MADATNLGPITVAIIGAGLSGLLACRQLERAGHVCVVFERLAAPGGGVRSYSFSAQSEARQRVCTELGSGADAASWDELIGQLFRSVRKCVRLEVDVLSWHESETGVVLVCRALNKGRDSSIQHLEFTRVLATGSMRVPSELSRHANVFSVDRAVGIKEVLVAGTRVVIDARSKLQVAIDVAVQLAAAGAWRVTVVLPRVPWITSPATVTALREMGLLDSCVPRGGHGMLTAGPRAVAEQIIVSGNGYRKVGYVPTMDLGEEDGLVFSAGLFGHVRAGRVSLVQGSRVASVAAREVLLDSGVVLTFDTLLSCVYIAPPCTPPEPPADAAAARPRFYPISPRVAVLESLQELGDIALFHDKLRVIESNVLRRPCDLPPATNAYLTTTFCERRSWPMAALHTRWYRAMIREGSPLGRHVSFLGLAWVLDSPRHVLAFAVVAALVCTLALQLLATLQALVV